MNYNTSKSRGDRLDEILEKIEDGVMTVSGIVIGLSTFLALL